MKLSRILAALLALTLCFGMASVAHAANCTHYQKYGTHDWRVISLIAAPTCTEQGVQHLQCIECAENLVNLLDKTGHVYGDWAVTRKATDHEMGLQKRSCLTCGSTQEQQMWPVGTVHHDTKDQAAIRALQDLLVQGGYLTYASGVYDEATDQAVRKVQYEARYNVNGIAWPQTINYLKQKLDASTPAATQAPAQEQQPAVPAPAGESHPQQAHCYRIHQANGAELVVYCAAHQLIAENGKAMVDMMPTADMKKTALTLSRSLWESELELLYADWVNQSSDEDKAIVLSHKAMFSTYLNMQLLMWNRQYGEGSVEAAQCVIDALMSQCADLCALVGFSGMAAQ